MRNPFRRGNRAVDEVEVEEVDIYYDEDDQPVVAVDLDAVEATLDAWTASMSEKWAELRQAGEHERAERLELTDDQQRALVEEAYNDRSNWLRHSESPSGDRVGIFRLNPATGRIESGPGFRDD